MEECKTAAEDNAENQASNWAAVAPKLWRTTSPARTLKFSYAWVLKNGERRPQKQCKKEAPQKTPSGEGRVRRRVAPRNCEILTDAGEFESIKQCKNEGVEEAKKISRKWVREWSEETAEYLK